MSRLVGFARPRTSLDKNKNKKKNSIVLATMCTNMRIEIIINHSFKSLEGNKKEDN